MRRIFGFLAGVVVGQWLVFGSGLSPADIHSRAAAAYDRRDYVEALRLWSQAVALQPAEARFHYLRGQALAHLGMRTSAADAFQVSLLLEPTSDLARDAMAGLAGLASVAAPDGDVVVGMEQGAGVWIVTTIINGIHEGRFLLDTGSSVVVVSPAFAASSGLPFGDARDAIELQTLGGRTRGPASTVGSLRVGTAELNDLPVVIHDPGPGLDGILGNTFLSHYLVTVDADRRQLTLRPLARPVAQARTSD
ncbi:MAG TPA: aspartyl protease family protein [Methylomirabilota bacterium]|jgi:predicted aspartyl protease